MSPLAFRTHLRDLRKRRGVFRSSAAAEAELSRLLARLAPGSMERKVFELSEILRIPFKSVAAQLGVSERHLYRIRVALFEQLAAEPVPATANAVSPPELQQLELANTLIRYGHASRGQEIADRLLRGDLPAMHAVRALTVRALALSDQERYDDARAALHEARHCACELDADESRSGMRAIAMAEAYVPYRDGLSDLAIELSENALSAGEPLSGDPLETRRFARDLIFLGIQHEEANSPRRGLQCLEKAYSLLARLPVPPSSELAQIFIHRALMRASLPDETARASADAEEALRLSQWHGLRYEEVWANLILGILSDMAGKPHEGIPRVDHAVELATSIFEGDPLVRTLFITARIEGAAGFGDAALERLQFARPLTKNHGLLRGVLEVAEARARRQRGEPAETIAAATRAVEILEGRSHTHYLGITYLARAIARAELGIEHAADVERSLYYLEGGALTEKARAFELSYNITRNRRDLIAARELRHAARHIA